MSVKQIGLWGIAAVVIGCAVWFFRDISHQLHEWLFYIQQQQNHWHRDIAKALSALRRGNDPEAWWSLVSLGFAYGVLHAIGPGHGKAVVSTFLLTQPGHYKSAVLLSVGGALLQAVSAVLWVALTLGVMQWFIREAVGQMIWAERLSYTLIILAGGYIIYRQCRHSLSHAADCGCAGHSHEHPSHQSVLNTQTAFGRSYWLTMLAVGIRPCSGAILALAVAAGWGLWGVGIAMTFAIALGTALTVLVLALLTVLGRERLALHISNRSRYWVRGFQFLVLAGGFVLIVLGLMMLLSTNTTTGGGLGRI